MVAAVEGFQSPSSVPVPVLRPGGVAVLRQPLGQVGP